MLLLKRELGFSTNPETELSTLLTSISSNNGQTTDNPTRFQNHHNVALQCHHLRIQQSGISLSLLHVSSKLLSVHFWTRTDSHGPLPPCCISPFEDCQSERAGGGVLIGESR
ncbi:hypothetical protein CDAR_20491 [Caerostris darwini]|uniref:Uncharacterized protein n=1 Tax=Caerostris darwini TaxID=1538125 RepID=A0AAV4QIR1_9ARAC|nr:hypothetical protein CDAR_20491 [Caerostris darwini]